MRILGAVLAGGQSRRFGSDKAEAMLHGTRLIDHAAAALAPFVESVIVVGRIDARHTSIADAPAPGLGPLGGLCGALLHASRNRFDAALTIACDVPELPSAVANTLIASAPAVLHSQPVIGCWPAAMADDLRSYLASDARRAVMAWVERSGAILVEGGILANINTPDDLRQL